MKLDTLAVHKGEPKVSGSVCMPIFQSANFVSRNEENYQDILYGRLSNLPNHVSVQEKLAAIEGAEAALVTSSGMSAITTSLMQFVRQGDHILAQNTLYGGTWGFLENICDRMGVSVSYFDSENPVDLESKVQSNTKVIYLETISNPLMQVPDFEKIVSVAKAKGIATFVDNTVASPIVCRPLELGVDVVLYSASKSLNGHSDIIAGAILGRKSVVEDIRKHLIYLGGSLDANSCHLLQRGLKTIALRVERQCQNAQAVAEFLSQHPQVAKVHYPTLSGNTSAAQYLKSGGGLVSFDIHEDAEKSLKVIESLNLFVNAPSLGGVESLATRPAFSSHAAIEKQRRQELGITDSLIRLSMGIEATEDLITDLKKALNS